ncbi:hypothetical protein ACFFII_17355, partial [Paracoccus niistensis]
SFAWLTLIVLCLGYVAMVIWGWIAAPRPPVLGSGPIEFHGQNMMVAASAMAQRKTFGHLP